jgi:hypothetical protein
MRLTLRTLLAYLDDTIEPTQIKPIGQKVSESDAAQELIARIKQVTRRRRLTTPPATGPNAFDPNTVAEYLDNELSPEEMAEVEKRCMESDVHLAEVAACHQILTLVLGEPALVPPPTRERMYGLVRGREAIPYRKARKAVVAGEESEEEDFFLSKRGWMLWAVPLAVVFLIVALSVAVWQAWPDANPNPLAQSTTPAVTPPKGMDKTTDKDTPVKPGGSPSDKGTTPGGTPPGSAHPPTPPGGGTPNGKEPGGTPSETPMPPAPSPPTPLPPGTEREVVGHYVPGAGPFRDLSLLAQRQAKPDASWSRVQANDNVWTSDELVSLPGYASEIRLNSGVGLLLRGNVPEFSVPGTKMFYMLDSAVVLNKPEKGVDADVSLKRGRLFVTNRKGAGPAVVRLRFAQEVWELILEEPDTEVGLDLFRDYTVNINYRADEDSFTELYLCVLAGKASLQVDTYHFSNLSAPPGPSLYNWNNFTGSPQSPTRLPQIPAIWGKMPPDQEGSQAMTVALKGLSARTEGTTPLVVALQEGRNKNDFPSRALSIYSLGALDEVKELIEILGDEDPAHARDRLTAIYVLRLWISRDGKQGRRLYDDKTTSGLLLEDKKYDSKEAEKIYVLLHDFPPQERQPELFELLANYLEHRKVAIAELAWHHLRGLAFGEKLPAFNAADPAEQRELVANEIKRMVSEGKLPPSPRSLPAPTDGGN